MCDPNRRSDQVWVKRVFGMLAKEFGVYRKQIRIQDLLHAGKVNLRVFGIGMIAVDQNGRGGEQGETGYKSRDTFSVQSEVVPFSKRLTMR